MNKLLLISGLLAAGITLAAAPSPVSVLENFFLHFNAMDKQKLNETSDSPFIFSIGGSTTSSERYGDSINFEGLIDSGWAYSKLNQAKLIYQDEATAMVDVSFTRHGEDGVVISDTNAVYMLVKKDNTWKLKAGFIPRDLTLGN